MRILLTNDDGIHADGLAALERIAEQLSDDVWVCAPEYEQSGMSRALTLAEPIRVREVAPRRFATTGTPKMSAMSWRQTGDFAPPPVTRISLAFTPSTARRRRP